MKISDSLRYIQQSKNRESKEQRTLYGLCCIFLCVLLAASVNAQAPDNQNSEESAPPEETPKSARKAINTAQEHSQRLSEEVNSEDLVWLEAEGDKFIGLWLPDTSSASYGAVIVLHAPGDTPNTPHTVQALRKNLSFHGWSTLAIELPGVEALSIPKRVKRTPPPMKKEGESENASTEGETDPDTPPLSQEEIDAAIDGAPTATAPKPDPENISEQRLNAAMKFLHDKGQYNIAVVAFGANAVRVSKFITSLKPTKAKTITRRSKFNMRSIRAYVMVDAMNQLRKDTQAEGYLPLTSYFKDPTLPVMDIYYTSAWGMDDVKKRKSAAQNNKYETYLQVKLMPPSTSEEGTYENSLTRRVRGFLDSHARGVEVDR